MENYEIKIRYDPQTNTLETTKNQVIYSGSVYAYRLIITGIVGNCEVRAELQNGDIETKELVCLKSLDGGFFYLRIPDRAIKQAGVLKVKIAVLTEIESEKYQRVTMAELDFAVLESGTDEPKPLEFSDDEKQYILMLNEALSDYKEQIDKILSSEGKTDTLDVRYEGVSIVSGGVAELANVLGGARFVKEFTRSDFLQISERCYYLSITKEQHKISKPIFESFTITELRNGVDEDIVGESVIGDADVRILSTGTVKVYVNLNLTKYTAYSGKIILKGE